MDSRTAAHTLHRIGDLLELGDSDRFRPRAYRTAARAVLALDADDLRPLFRSGALAAVPGIGPAILGVLAELLEHGESSYLERLQETIPEGLLALLRVPSLTASKVRRIYDALGVRTLEELEQAAVSGRLAQVRGFGPKTAARVMSGIAVAREAQGLRLLPHATDEAARLVAAVLRHPDVRHAAVAGDVRRGAEVIGTITVVARCDADPSEVVRDFAGLTAARHAEFPGPRVAHVRFVDGTHLRIACASAEQYPVTLWRETGNDRHVARVLTHARSLGLHATDDDRLIGPGPSPVPIDTEEALYEALRLDWVPPELREGEGEVEAARDRRLPRLITESDLAGVLHCHSTYSDGTASIAEMAEAARARGWQYIGMTDHSVSASYAGGLTPEAVRRQHDEIDRLNDAGDGFRILKGIECDILADGTLDYDDTLLARFDYVVGSVHSRFAMDRKVMTRRILTALENPRLTILAHPTGRLLLRRAPYAVDLDAVVEKAAETRTVLELNADPQRLDLDWRWCRVARERGVLVEIGPDAHSTRGLDNVGFGVRMARKAWLGPHEVFNARSAGEVVAQARSKLTR